MRLTYLPTITSDLTAAEVAELTWEEVGEFFKHQYDPQYSKKEELPIVFPGTFKAGEKRRTNTAVEAVHLAMLDFDDCSDLELGAIEEGVSGLAYCICTTWSNKKHREATNHWKFRLVMPLSRPVTAEEWPVVWRAVNHRFGTIGDKVLADKACKNAGRIYFVSQVPYSPNEDGGFDHDYYSFSSGQPLNVEQALERGKLLGGQAEVAEPKGADNFYIDQLTPLAKKLAKSDSGVHAQVSAWIKKLIKGTPLPFEKGGRHQGYLLLCKVLVETYTKVDPTVLYKVALKRSVDQLNQEHSDDPITEQEIVALLTGAQEKIKEVNAAKKEERDQEEEDLCKLVGTTPYTQEEMEGWAKDLGLTLSELSRHLVIQIEENYWCFFRGKYLEYNKSVAPTALHERLRPAAKVMNLRLRKESRDEVVDKTPIDLVRDYGLSSLNLRMEAGRTHFGFDHSKSLMYVPLFARKNWQPEKSEFVEGWLTTFSGGDEEKLAVLEQWIGWSIDLTKPLALLFLSGAAGAGKTLFPQALSSIWESDFTETDNVFTQFNSEMLSSPVVLADEGFPQDQTRRIRSFLGRNKHKVEQKYHAVKTIESNYRFVVTANDEATFYNLRKEVLGAFDLEALAIRTLHLEAPEDATEYLEAAGPERIEEMLKSGEFAQHAVYLAEKHKDAPRGRFGTKPDKAMVRKVTVSSGVPSQLMRWVIGYLLSDKIEKKKQSVSKVRVQEGNLLLTMRAFEDWDTYLGESKPSYDDIRQAFGTITTSKQKIRRAPGAQRAGDRQNIEFNVLSIAHLEAWMDANPSHANYHQVMDALKTDTPINWHKPVGG
jgi:hypothetical protein